MAKERLSKLQRWILKHAFMKMKQMKMPDDWIWCRHDDEYHDDESVIIDKRFNDRPPSLGTHLRKTFFKYDILANYFHLEQSPWPSYKAPGRYFAGEHAANNHAQVTVHNCLKNMEAKGLITVLTDEEHSNADEISLTEKGASLILNDINAIKDKGIDGSEDIDPQRFREALENYRFRQHWYRSLKNMEAKGLITVLWDEDRSKVDEILLTEEGESLILRYQSYEAGAKDSKRMPDNELIRRIQDIETGTEKDVRFLRLLVEARDQGLLNPYS